ncbi:ankyrin repeat and SOCS box protein 1 isoform X2 [Rhineura floridana]|uniref:ankyrin repeat and SOCS box protein 1 isoform X2 n=1 Tax=Rhineura floridana TaxID=261503 RepID=UPI002AC85BCB|nr:ankyrin repeat and SOCS box protein 1 isoform X2 [Rhineura floridana]
MADASNPDSQDAGTDVPEHEARESLAAQTPGNGHGIRLSAMSGNAGRNLKEWLKEQFCDHPIEHCADTRLHDAAYVGDLQTIRNLLEEESFQRYGADVDVNHHWTSGIPSPSSRPLTSLVVCPLYISAAYHNLPCFRLLLQAGANPDFNSCGPVNIQGFSRGSAVCVMDAVLRHGCDVAFVNLLIDFGANLNLVKWETLGEEATGRIKVNPEAMQVFKEARSCPRSLMSLCRVAVLRALGKCRLQLIHTLPVPDPIMKFLLYEQQDPQGTTEGVIYLIFIYLFIVFIYRPIARSSLGGLQQL